jgi:ribosomal protein L40E
MAEFLTTSGTSHHIENIILEAKAQLILVSPYLQISKTLFERLKDASKRRVNITIVYGKDELKPNERNSLSQIESLELYYFENLHAKCYYNETTMVITSMNMYEFSEKNNREMGVLIKHESDSTIYNRAATETQSIIQSSERVYLTKLNSNQIKRADSQKPMKKTDRGYCIRCEDRILFDTNKPLCEDCYFIWASYSNPDYEESVCHKCGEYSTTSMRAPQCFKCYQETQKSLRISI